MDKEIEMFLYPSFVFNINKPELRQLPHNVWLRGIIMKTNTNEFIIRMGQISFEGRSGIPTMALNLVEVDPETKEDKIIQTGYLTPFRGYSFQISGNKKGDCDMGSSPVIAFYKDAFASLTQFKNYQVLNPVLKGQAMMAIVQFTNNAYCEKTVVENGEIKNFIHVNPRVDLSMVGARQLDRFIAESIKWIGLGDDVAENCEYGMSSDNNSVDIVPRKEAV